MKKNQRELVHQCQSPSCRTQGLIGTIRICVLALRTWTLTLTVLHFRSWFIENSILILWTFFIHILRAYCVTLLVDRELNNMSKLGHIRCLLKYISIGTVKLVRNLSKLSLVSILCGKTIWLIIFGGFKGVYYSKAKTVVKKSSTYFFYSNILTQTTLFFSKSKITDDGDSIL